MRRARRGRLNVPAAGSNSTMRPGAMALSPRRGVLRGEPGHRSAGHVARSRGAVPGVTGRDTGPTGTIDARVTFAGTPDVKTIKINKDVKRCGTETTIETIRMGDDQGLAY